MDGHGFCKSHGLTSYEPVCIDCFQDLQKELAAKDAEIARLREGLKEAFLQGARWWEYHTHDATMWQTDQELVMQEAIRKEINGTLGKQALKGGL